VLVEGRLNAVLLELDAAQQAVPSTLTNVLQFD